MFFLVVYIHIGRGIYYGSYQKPREFVWMVGVVVLILMIALLLWAMYYRGVK